MRNALIFNEIQGDKNAACGDCNFRVRRWQSPPAAFDFPRAAFLASLCPVLSSEK